MANFTILEPMSTGDVIDRAVRLYRRNFTALVAIVAVPSVIGYLAGLAFTSGYAQLLTSVASPGSSGMEGSALLLLILGLMGQPVWFFVYVFTVTGLARVIGDHLMLGEAITFRRCFSAARQRLGDITLLALLMFGVLFLIGAVASVIFFAVFMVVAIVVGVTAGTGMPPWLGVALLIIFSLLAVAAGIALFLIVAARIIFLPQVLMIEGMTAGSSLGRSISLGQGNWYRVGAILLFTYFVSLSMLAALTLPVILGIELFGSSSSVELLLTPAGSAIYSAFNHTANLLSLPIWIVSFTLLYFDNRVRKEGYDMELLAREVAPGFRWQAPAAHPAQPYGTFTPGAPLRVFMQTGPLGLGGYAAPRPEPQTSTTGQASFQGPQPPSGAPTIPVLAPAVTGAVAGICQRCGLELQPGARFCIRCGSQN
jgi:hypothetical protein